MDFSGETPAFPWKEMSTYDKSDYYKEILGINKVSEAVFFMLASPITRFFLLIFLDNIDGTIFKRSFTPVM